VFIFLVPWGFKKLTEIFQFPYSEDCLTVYKELSILEDEIKLPG